MRIVEEIAMNKIHVKLERERRGLQREKRSGQASTEESLAGSDLLAEADGDAFDAIAGDGAGWDPNRQ